MNVSELSTRIENKLEENNLVGEETVNNNPCNWQECKNNKDWFYVGCINQKVNIWKLARKKHITLIQLFQSCPYCKGKVVMR